MRAASWRLFGPSSSPFSPEPSARKGNTRAEIHAASCSRESRYSRPSEAWYTSNSRKSTSRHKRHERCQDMVTFGGNSNRKTWLDLLFFCPILCEAAMGRIAAPNERRQLKEHECHSVLESFGTQRPGMEVCKTHSVLQMSAEAAVIHKHAERRLRAGTPGFFCGAPQVGVEHRLQRQTWFQTRLPHTGFTSSPSHPPASQSRVQPLQRRLPEGQDLLPCGLVAEQVVQVSQSQLWFGLHRLLDTHLPAAAPFLLRVDKQYSVSAFSFTRLLASRWALGRTDPLLG